MSEASPKRIEFVESRTRARTQARARMGSAIPVSMSGILIVTAGISQASASIVRHRMTAQPRWHRAWGMVCIAAKRQWITTNAWQFCFVALRVQGTLAVDWHL